MFSQAPHSSAPQSAQFVKIISVASAMVAQSVMASSGVVTKPASASMVAQSSMTCDAGNTFSFASPMVTSSTMAVAASAQRPVDCSMIAQSSMTANALGTFVIASQQTAQSDMNADVNKIMGFVSSFAASSITTSAIRHYWENVPPITENWTDNMPFRR